MRCWSARVASVSKARRSVDSSVCRSLMLSSSARCGVYSDPSFALEPGRVWICSAAQAARPDCCVRQGSGAGSSHAPRARLDFQLVHKGVRQLVPGKDDLVVGVQLPARKARATAKLGQGCGRDTRSSGATQRTAVRTRRPHILIRFPSVWSSRCTVKVPALATFVSATKATLRCPSGTMNLSYKVGAFIAASHAGAHAPRPALSRA